MYQRYKERFGTAGVVLGVIALILALGGTALAASKLNGTQKKEVEKIAKKYSGKPGAPGAAGTNGTNGTNGKDGAPGAPGKDGTSVTGASIPVGNVECPAKEGGVKYTSASGSNAVCNGKEGKAGKDGTTGFTDTLPPGKTETGTWSILASVSQGIFSASDTAISFPIPLAEAAEEKAFVFNQSETANEEFGTTECAGTFETPTAPAGKLCVYTAEEELEHVTGHLEASLRPAVFSNGYGPSGAFLSGFVLHGTAEIPARVEARGTWAVTAP